MGAMQIESSAALADKPRQDAAAVMREAFATFVGARVACESGSPPIPFGAPSRTQTSQPGAREGFGLRPWV